MSTPAKPVRVLLVDDHPAVLRQVIRLLPDEYEITEVFHSSLGLNEWVKENDPDLIVLDITLPGISGLDIGRRLTSEKCRSKIVFLTVHGDPDYVREAFECGASGYVLKSRIATDLHPALSAALCGQRFISDAPELQSL